MNFLTISFIYAKISAVFGLLGAVLFALTDNIGAAVIAAGGTILAAIIGLINTWMLARVQKTAQANQKVAKGVAERVGAIHETARDSATVIREVTGTERRKTPRDD